MSNQRPLSAPSLQSPWFRLYQVAQHAVDAADHDEFMDAVTTTANALDAARTGEGDRYIERVIRSLTTPVPDDE